MAAPYSYGDYSGLDGAQGYFPGVPFMGMASQGLWNQPHNGGGGGGGGSGPQFHVRLPVMPLPRQTQDVEDTRWHVTNSWPELAADCVLGMFSPSQTGEILTVRAPRDGEEWMVHNLRQDEQRWSGLNSQIAVLLASRVAADKTTLEQLESLVQPTQFLERSRKTMPMSEAQLDLVTTMHDMMIRRLNALDVLFKGGQQAVDEFMSSTLTGMEKLKSVAILKAKRGADGNGGPPRKRNGRGGGGGGGPGGGEAATAASVVAAAAAANRTHPEAQRQAEADRITDPALLE
jgi:hypothetical protein